MPKVTYRERVKNILHIFARDHQDTIPYVQFIERVKDSMLLDLLRLHRGTDALVQKALLSERFARRVKFAQSLNGSMILVLTPSGLEYFKWYGVVGLHHKDMHILGKFTLRQLRQETNTLNCVLDNIRNVLSESDCQYFTPSSIANIPTAVARVIQKIQDLNEQNTELMSILAGDRAMEHAIQSGHTPRGTEN
ncbi:hypothetical protein C8Q78DRAFT_1082530 [Trametes maxima]|nr:hypothetical protein C8Q78DRAFT_1082530 [Trametes maxima]